MTILCFVRNIFINRSMIFFVVENEKWPYQNPLFIHKHDRNNRPVSFHSIYKLDAAGRFYSPRKLLRFIVSFLQEFIFQRFHTLQYTNTYTLEVEEKTMPGYAFMSSLPSVCLFAASAVLCCAVLCSFIWTEFGNCWYSQCVCDYYIHANNVSSYFLSYLK